MERRDEADEGASGGREASSDARKAIGQKIWSAIQASNAAWTHGDPHGVAPLFAEDVIAVAPGLAVKLEGREALVKSYVDYCREVRTLAFRELEHAVDVCGDVAVATYRFEVRYETDGKTFDELGQEVLVFAKREAGWQAVWRTQIFLGAPPASQGISPSG